MVIYVDDAYIAAKSEELIKELVDFLKLEVEIRSLNGDSFLGLRVEKEKDGIFLNQRTYIERTLKRFNMDNAKPVATPIQTEKVNMDAGQAFENEQLKKQLAVSST